MPLYRSRYDRLQQFTFAGGDSDDRLLGEAVLPLLQSLAACADVRPKLNARFNMPHWFKAQGVSLPVEIIPRPMHIQPGMAQTDSSHIML